MLVWRSFKITFNSQSYVSVLYKLLPTSLVIIGQCTLFLLLAKILMLKLEKYYILIRSFPKHRSVGVQYSYYVLYGVAITN